MTANNASLKISKAMQPILSGLSDALEDIADEPIGFALIVFTAGRASYGSNCDRAEVVTEIKKLLTYWEAGMPDVPAHKVD